MPDDINLLADHFSKGLPAVVVQVFGVVAKILKVLAAQKIGGSEKRLMRDAEENIF